MKVDYLDSCLTHFPRTEEGILRETLMHFKALMHTATPANLRYKATECFPEGTMRPAYYKAFFYPHIAIFLHFTCHVSQQKITVQKITHHFK